LRDKRLNYAIEQFRKAMLISQDIEKGVIKEPSSEYKTSRIYPDAKLLRRERKVIDRVEKEKYEVEQRN